MRVTRRRAVAVASQTGPTLFQFQSRVRHFLQLVRLPGKQLEGDGLAVHRACELPHGPDPDGKCIKTDFYFTDVDPDILHVFFAAVIA